MSIGQASLLLVGSFAFTVASSIVLARELDRLGERLGFSEALLGIVTAIGADAPEIASAVTAIVAGHEDTGVGVVVGSNVFNLAGLLGLSALIAGPVRIHKHGLALTGGVAVLVALVGALVAVGTLPGVVGLLIALLVLVPYLVLSSSQPSSAGRQGWSSQPSRLATIGTCRASCSVRSCSPRSRVSPTFSLRFASRCTGAVPLA